MAYLKLNCSSCWKQKKVEIEGDKIQNNFRLVCTCGMKTETSFDKSFPVIEVHCETSSIPYSLQAKKTRGLPPMGQVVLMEGDDE